MHAAQIDDTVFEKKALQSPNALTSKKAAYVHDKTITEIGILGKKFGKNETQYLAWKDVPDVEKISPNDLKHFKVSRKATHAEDLAFQKMLKFSNKPILFRKPGIAFSHRYKFVTPQNKVVFKKNGHYYKPKQQKQYYAKKDSKSINVNKSQKTKKMDEVSNSSDKAKINEDIPQE